MNTKSETEQLEFEIEFKKTFEKALNICNKKIYVQFGIGSNKHSDRQCKESFILHDFGIRGQKI